jgi:hypothetical protein
MSVRAAQELVGWITGVGLPVMILAYMALITRPWNIRKKSD